MHRPSRYERQTPESCRRACQHLKPYGTGRMQKVRLTIGRDRLLAAQSAIELHMAIEGVRTCESFPAFIAGSGGGPEVNRGNVLPEGSIVHRAVCARTAMPFTPPSLAVIPFLHVVLLEVPRNPRGGQVVKLETTFLPPLASNAS